jgi:mRNA interferase RelE/StbE
MAYQILIRRSAEKELADLPRDIQARIIDPIRQLSVDPRPPGCKKLSGLDSAWRIRIGNYRVVYAINDASQRVEIRAIAHRRDVYR